jgi:fatty-acyl-CoA synthase
VPANRVALLAYNRVEWMAFCVALARAGLIAVWINCRLASPEIAYIVEHSEASAIIVHDELLDRAAPLRAILPVAPHRHVPLGGEATDGWPGYEALIVEAFDAPPEVAVLPDDASTLLYTSGTTGKPRAAIRSHESSTLIALATPLETGFTRDDTVLPVRPMCHANWLLFSHTWAPPA